MSDGGVFPWKVQKHVQKPVGDYSKLQKPLPTPPANMEWKRDERSREWLLTPKKTSNNQPLTPDDQPQQQQPPALILEESTTTTVCVDHLPGSTEREDEWELLSDKHSASNDNNSAGNCDRVFVPRAGSVRSIASVEGSSQLTGSSPFKIQRTHSSSTIDSCDNAAPLGPAGKGILGVDYVEHVVLPTDTLQGLCLAYKISTTRLRQANHFSGNSLLLAPKKLVIPISQKALKSGFIRAQDTDAKEYKLHAFLAEFTDLTMTEAKAYLELADWNLPEAMHSAREDREWEREMDSNLFKSGEIRITMNMERGIPIGYSAKGAGISLPKSSSSADRSTPAAPRWSRATTTTTTTSTRVVPVTDIPAIATKTTKAEDIYKAASQHDNFGVELKPLLSSRSGESS